MTQEEGDQEAYTVKEMGEREEEEKLKSRGSFKGKGGIP